MTHNKNKKYILCKECGRKRYCEITKQVPHFVEWTCSKNHSWLQDNRYGEIVAIELERIIPQIKNIFDRDDAFLAFLKKRN